MPRRKARFQCASCDSTLIRANKDYSGLVCGNCSYPIPLSKPESEASKWVDRGKVQMKNTGTKRK